MPATFESLKKARARLFKECFRIRRGERVAIAMDTPTRIAKALEIAAIELGGKVVGTIKLNPLRAHSAPIPRAKKLFSHADIVVAPTSKSISHSPETWNAKKNGTRFASMPGITEELFVQAMSADFSQIRKNCARLKKIFDKANSVRVLAENGTDIALDVSGMKFESDDGVLWKKGKLCNVPFGEICTAPIDANGIIVPNSMMRGVNSKGLGTITVIDGKLAFVENCAKKFAGYLGKFGKCARVVGELGFGTNPAFKKPTGLILQDEKIAGSVHVAFGASCCYSSNKCKVHEDAVVEKARVWANGKEIKL